MKRHKEPLLPWNSFPEGKILAHEPNLWVVRIGVVVNRPKKSKKFEDSYVALHQLSGESSSILGYTLTVKREFDKIFDEGTFLSLISKVDHHTNPKFLYKDQKVHLMRFNSNRSPSYWFLVRHRPS